MKNKIWICKDNKYPHYLYLHHFALYAEIYYDALSYAPTKEKFTKFEEQLSIQHAWPDHWLKVQNKIADLRVKPFLELYDFVDAHEKLVMAEWQQFNL